MTTVYYQAKWSSRFSEENTAPQTFHSPVGDVTVDFMHTSFDGHYYWGDQFGAAGLSLANGGGTMWFLLPDEGVSPEDLLADPEAMDFLLSGGEWGPEEISDRQSGIAEVRYFVPKSTWARACRHWASPTSLTPTGLTSLRCFRATPRTSTSPRPSTAFA